MSPYISVCVAEAVFLVFTSALEMVEDVGQGIVQIRRPGRLLRW